MFVFPAGTLAATVTRTLITTVSSTANAASYTFASTDIGTASADRLVVVCALGSGQDNRTFTSITVGGETLTQAAFYGGNNKMIGLYYGTITTGTTADIVVTLSNTQSRFGIIVYTITGLNSSTPVDTGSNGSTGTQEAIATTIDYTNGGVVIGAALNDAVACTWTNLTEDYDSSVEAAMEMTSASKAVSSTVAGETITATFTGASALAAGIVVASWR